MQYSALVIEDTKSNRVYYDPIFSDTEILWSITNPEDYQSFVVQVRRFTFDAYIIDINLDSWGVDLVEVLRELPTGSLVFFASFKWDQTHTVGVLNRAAVAISDRSLVLAGLLDLQAANSSAKDSIACKRYLDSIKGSMQLMLSSRSTNLFAGKNDVNTIRILHVSDPQYGDPGQDDWASFVEDNISSYVQETLNFEIDLMAITGDITYSGQPSQFATAENSLRHLSREIWPNEDGCLSNRVLLVPGNHDFNFRLSAAEKVSYSISKKEVSINPLAPASAELSSFGLVPFREFFERMIGRSSLRNDRTCTGIITAFESFGLRFHLLNSVSSFSCDNPTIPEVSISEPKELMRSIKRTIALRSFGISLSHHGIYPISASTVQNRADLCSYLQANSVRLHIHGHGHGWSACRYGYDGAVSSKLGGQLDDNEFVQVMAPSTHVGSDLRPKDQLRGFNLIALGVENGVVRSCDVRSYGWDKKFIEIDQVRFRV